MTVDPLALIRGLLLAGLKLTPTSGTPIGLIDRLPDILEALVRAAGGGDAQVLRVRTAFRDAGLDGVRNLPDGQDLANTADTLLAHVYATVLSVDSSSDKAAAVRQS